MTIYVVTFLYYLNGDEMNAYIDLSYLFSVLVIATFPYYFKKILNVKIKKIEIFCLMVFVAVLYFNIFIFAQYTFLNYLYLFIYFLLLYRNKAIKYYLVFLIVYYGNLASIMIFNDSIYLLKGMVFLNKPSDFLYIILELMNIVFIELIFLSIKSIKLFKNYRKEVEIKIDDIYIKVGGYIDSGNTLIINDLPVVFLQERFFKNKEYKEMIVKGIGVRKCKYFETQIKIDDKEKEVIVASGDSRGYKGCECLININLMGDTEDETIK